MVGSNNEQRVYSYYYTPNSENRNNNIDFGAQDDIIHMGCVFVRLENAERTASLSEKG
jgi:hypothetical protein